MPKEGISIYFTIQDGASQVLATIGDKTKALDKETQQLAQSQAALQKSNEPLIQKQQELRVRLEEVSRTLSDARSAWKQYDSAIAKEAMEEAIQEQDELKRALRETEDQIKSNAKAHNELRESIRKGAMQELEGTEKGGKEEAGILSLLSKSGLTRLLGDAVSQFAGYWIESMLGQPTANLVSSTLSGRPAA